MRQWGENEIEKIEKFGKSVQRCEIGWEDFQKKRWTWQIFFVLRTLYYSVASLYCSMYTVYNILHWKPPSDFERKPPFDMRQFRKMLSYA